MRNYYFFYFLICIVFCSCKKDCKTFTISYKNGNLRETFIICDGKKNGIHKKYYIDGSLKSKSEWKNDMLHGEKILYYQNGNIEQKSYWTNGKKDSLLRNYYLNGIIKEIVQMKNDLANGFYKEKYINGTIKVLGQYEDGKAIGDFYYYNTYGSIEKIKKYIIRNNKVMLNEFIYFDKDSNIIRPKSSFVKSKFLNNQDIIIELISGADFADIIIGKFDKNFNITDSLSIDTIFNNDMSLEIKIKERYISSDKYIRGIIREGKMYKDSSLSIREIFFEDSIRNSFISSDVF